MNVLIIGAGGREHAIAWKISQSRLLDSLFIVPGNAGTEDFGVNVNIKTTDFEEIAKLVEAENISMVIIGPEDPLVTGIVDFFYSRKSLQHVALIGPSKLAAQLEGSKDFSKAFMERHKIPTARYKSFTKDKLKQSFEFLKSLEAPYVIKASGLAAGKGVIIENDIENAKSAVEEMFSGKFGNAGDTIVIEEFLNGIECSVFALCDGKDFLLLPEAKDYKRIGEKDTGLNTGGMGAVSPVPFFNETLKNKVIDQIITPTLEGLNEEGIPYVGFLFIGLMIVNQEPFVIEYNCRLGDPETEVVIPRIQNDLLELFNHVAQGSIKSQKISINPQTALTVMCVSGGYPEQFEKNKKIEGLDVLKKELLFHAGTHYENGNVFTSGGRVLAFTSISDSIEACRKNSYNAISKICYEGIYFRKDIGEDLLAYKPKS
jgi:phosphoribosylamine--glycine ligase